MDVVPSIEQTDTTVEQDIALILRETNHCLRPICKALESNTKVEDELWGRLDTFFTFLERINLRPGLRDKARLHRVIGMVFDPPRKLEFPEDWQVRARTLYNRCTTSNWGEPIMKTITQSHDMADVQVGEIIPVPLGHPIFGKDGIMGGCALRKGHKRPVLNDLQFDRPSYKVFGHNGLESGDWFAYRLCMVARGGHGASQAGICGNQESGAYAIVTAGQYDELDRDCGKTLFYAGSGSHDNKNKIAASKSTSGTNALKTSLKSGKPVRVFRSYSAGNQWSPQAGIRYDGLYKVVAMHLRTNAHSGKYEQFKLERLDGQPEINLNVPSAQQLADLEAVAHGYPPATEDEMTDVPNNQPVEEPHTPANKTRHHDE